MTRVRVVGYDGQAMVTTLPLVVDPYSETTPPENPESPDMSDLIIFPAVEQKNDLNIGCYLKGRNPWREDNLTIGGTNVATGNVTFKLTRIGGGVLTMPPADGDYQARMNQNMLEALGRGASADEAIDMMRCNYDAECSGLYVEPSIGKPFYIARRPLIIGSAGGTLYAQSTIRPQETDGKRGIVYNVMAENDYGGDYGIRWDIKIDHAKTSDSSGGLG